MCVFQTLQRKFSPAPPSVPSTYATLYGLTTAILDGFTGAFKNAVSDQEVQRSLGKDLHRRLLVQTIIGEARCLVLFGEIARFSSIGQIDPPVAVAAYEEVLRAFHGSNMPDAIRARAGAHRF